MHEIFISYRHDDAAAWALLLRDALVARFGADRVYLDKDSQRAGDWKSQIQAGLARSKVVLVPIGPRWLDARTPDGQRRLDDPDDVHRWEVAQALVTPGTTVIPVLVDRASLPAAGQLPADLRALVAQQCREISYDAERRQVDVARVVTDIERSSGLVARKPDVVGTSWPQRIAEGVAAFVVTMVALTIADDVIWQALPFGAKVLVFVVGWSIGVTLRRLARHWRRRK